MASALSFLVNDNPQQDVTILDSFAESLVFENILQTNTGLLIANSKEIIMDAHYNLRPDLLSFEQYGTNFWYPAILVANKLGSIFQFKAEYMNNQCLVPNIEIIRHLMAQHKTSQQKKETE